MLKKEAKSQIMQHTSKNMTTFIVVEDILKYLWKGDNTSKEGKDRL